MTPTECICKKYMNNTDKNSSSKACFFTKDRGFAFVLKTVVYRGFYLAQTIPFRVNFQTERYFSSLQIVAWMQKTFFEQYRYC